MSLSFLAVGTNGAVATQVSPHIALVRGLMVQFPHDARPRIRKRHSGI